MKSSFLLGLFLCSGSWALGQRVLSSDFDETIQNYLSFSVPIMTVDEVHKKIDDVILLDAREYDEYKISHITRAVHIGYNEPDFSVLASLDSMAHIVVYCSIGYRSEKVGEMLRSKGFTKTYNLYGSFFEWANRDLPLYDIKGQKTNQIHGFNKSWSKWIDNSNLTVVW